MGRFQMRKVTIAIFLLSALVCAAARADFQPPPQHYTIVNAAPDGTQTIYRDGNQALIDRIMPKSQYQPKAMHLRTLVRTTTKQSLTWDLLDRNMQCDSPATSSDWGDPFNYWNQSVQSAPGKMTQTGKATVNGMKTTVFEVTSDQGTARLWREDRYGLLVKFEMTPKGGKPVTVINVTRFKVGRPNLSVFTLPKRCSWNK